MSSFRTKTMQKVSTIQIKERFNKDKITKDQEFETMYEGSVQFEDILIHLNQYFISFETALSEFSAFSEGFSVALLHLFAQTETHKVPIKQVSEIHKNLYSWFSDSATEAKGLLQSFSEQLKTFDTLKLTKKSREKSRLIYDHYIQKIDELKRTIDKKTERKPDYRMTPKESERMARVNFIQNERKLQQATDNFQSDTTKCKNLINQIGELKFSQIVPYISKVIQTELNLFKRGWNAVHSLTQIPELLSVANQDRNDFIKQQRKSENMKHHQSIRARQSSSDHPRQNREQSPKIREFEPQQRETRAVTVGGWEEMAIKGSPTDYFGSPQKLSSPDPYGGWSNAPIPEAEEPDDPFALRKPIKATELFAESKPKRSPYTPSAEQELFFEKELARANKPIEPQKPAFSYDFSPPRQSNPQTQDNFSSLISSPPMQFSFEPEPISQQAPPAQTPFQFNTAMPSQSFPMQVSPEQQNVMMQQFMTNMNNPEFRQQMHQNMMSMQNIMPGPTGPSGQDAPRRSSKNPFRNSQQL